MRYTSESTAQIVANPVGQELGLVADSAHDMATLPRNGILAKEPEERRTCLLAINLGSSIDETTIWPYFSCLIRKVFYNTVYEDLQWHAPEQLLSRVHP